MAVKSNIKNHCGECKPCRQYPWIGDCRNKVVVLFSEYAKGTVLADKCGIYEVGAYTCGWDMCNFEAFCGEICLSN
jgi:hypothetical protein